MPFWQFLREGWNGCALLVWPSKMHYSIWKIYLSQDFCCTFSRPKDFFCQYRKYVLNWNNWLEYFRNLTIFKTIALILKIYQRHLFYIHCSYIPSNSCVTEILSIFSAQLCCIDKYLLQSCAVIGWKMSRITEF